MRSVVLFSECGSYSAALVDNDWEVLNHTLQQADFLLFPIAKAGKRLKEQKWHILMGLVINAQTASSVRACYAVVSGVRSPSIMWFVQGGRVTAALQKRALAFSFDLYAGDHLHQ